MDSSSMRNSDLWVSAQQQDSNGGAQPRPVAKKLRHLSPEAREEKRLQNNKDERSRQAEVTEARNIAYSKVPDYLKPPDKEPTILQKMQSIINYIALLVYTLEEAESYQGQSRLGTGTSINGSAVAPQGPPLQTWPCPATTYPPPCSEATPHCAWQPPPAPHWVPPTQTTPTVGAHYGWPSTQATPTRTSANLPSLHQAVPYYATPPAILRFPQRSHGCLHAPHSQATPNIAGSCWSQGHWCPCGTNNAVHKSLQYSPAGFWR